MDIMQIVFMCIGGGVGGFIGWLIKGIQTKIKITEYENRALIAEKEKATMQTQWTLEKEKATKFQSLLADTLASMEILKAYQVVDEATKNNIKVLENTFKDGKATEETYAKYKQMIEEINKRNSEYNKGNKPKV